MSHHLQRQDVGFTTASAIAPLRRLAKISLVAIMAAAVLAGLSMHEAAPVSAQFAPDATVSVTCDATVIPGSSFSCDIEVENTSQNLIGNPAPLDGPLVLNYGFFDLEYVLDSIGDDGDFTFDTHSEGAFVAANGMGPGEVVDLSVTVLPSTDAHYSGGSDDIRFRAVLYQTQDRGIFPPPSAIADDEVEVDYAPDASLDIVIDNMFDAVGAAPGAIVPFVVKVCNAGPSDANGIGVDIAPIAGIAPGTVDRSPIQFFDEMYIRANGCVEALVTAQVDPAAAVGDLITIRAATDSSNADPGFANAITVTDDAQTRTADPFVIDALPDADLEVVSITPSTTVMQPGLNAAYSMAIEVANNGPAPAYGAILATRLFDVQWTIDSAQVPAGWEGAGNGTWIATEPLPSGYNETFTLNFYIPSDAHYQAPAGTLFFFNAYVGSASPDPVSANNGLFEQLTMEAQAFLTIAKNALNGAGAPPTPGGIAPGGTAWYEIEACNLGPSDIDGVTVVDTPGSGLDAATLYLSPDATSDYIAAGECADYLATVELLDTNAVGDALSNMAEFDLTGVNNGAATAFNAIDLSGASVAAGETGEYLPDADMDATTTIVPITAPPVAGQDYTFEVYVENLGPAPAEGAAAHVGLSGVPGSWQIRNTPGNPALGWSCDGNGQTCTRTGSMPVGRELVGTFTILLPENLMVDGLGALGGNPGLFFIDLQATANNPDPDFANNLVSEQQNAVGIAELEVTKSHSANPVTQGQTFSYEIVVENNGPTTLPENEVQVVDTLPVDVVFLGASPECVINGALTEVTCTVPDELAPQDSHDFWVTVRVKDNAPVNMPLVNFVETQTPNLVPPLWTVTQDDFTLNTMVIPGGADLKISKFVKPDDTVRAGDIFEYWIYVDNLGLFDAPGVVMTDTMISNGDFEVLSITEDRGGVCAPIPPFGAPVAPSINNEYKFQCDLPLLVANDRWTIRVEALALQPQTVNNDARVVIINDPNAIVPVRDPDMSNNMSMQSIAVTANADLSVEKVALGGFTLGNFAQYQITVENNGPSDSENVRIIDLLPDAVDREAIANATFTITDLNGAPAAGSCTFGGGLDPADRMVCNLNTIPFDPNLPVEGRVITFDVALDPGFGDVGLSQGDIFIRNEVNVTADTPDLNNSNNRDSEGTFVGRASDMEVDKTSLGPFPWIAGEVRTYQIAVENAGPTDATGAYIVDQLPVDFLGNAQVTYLSSWVSEVDDRAGAVPLGCDVASDNVVTCDLGTVERFTPSGPAPAPVTGAYVWIDVLVHADLLDGTPITNVVNAFSQNFDFDGATDQTLDIVNRIADMAVFKTSEPDLVFGGEEKEYTITVVNQGPSNASLINVQDFLPPWMTYAVDSNEFCTYSTPGASGGTVDCLYTKGAVPAELAPGEKWVFDIDTFVDADAPPNIQALNTAQVTALENDPNLADNFAFSRNLMLESADLRIQKFGKRDGQVRAGDILTYTVIVDNYGPSYATGTAIKDVLQSSFRFDLIDIMSDRDATCTTLANGALATNDLDAMPWPPVAAPPAFGVIAPTGIAMIQERLEADCVLRDDPATPEDESRLEVLEADGPPNSGRWILTMRVRAMEDQDINNVAEVTSDAYEDRDVTNNTAVVEHEITAVSDIEVTKMAVGEVQVVGQMGTIFDPATPGQPFPEAPNYTTSPTQVTAGRRIQYTLTVTNNGPTYAENVILTDRLPEGVTIYAGSLTASQGSCETGTPGEPLDRLVCGLGGLSKNPGSNTATVTFEVITDPDLASGAMLENDAYATSDNFDPTNENNHVNTQTVVNTWADVELAKGAVGSNKVAWDNDLRRFVFQDLVGQVTAGHDLRYEVVVQNKGPSVARNVQILDSLPQFAGGSDRATTFVRADGAECGADDENANLIWCQVGDLAPGERKTFDIYVHVDEAVADGTVLTNVAQVAFGPSSPPAQTPNAAPPFDVPVLGLTNDPFVTNNLALDNTNVNAVADVYIQKVDIPAAKDLDKAFEPDEAVAGMEHRYKITFGNNGWSVARDVAIQDFLDFKQFQILGERFLRCEPFDVDDFVACSENNGVVDLDLLLRQNNQIIPGDLRMGEEYSFYLITEVDAGYVLDADDFIATNDSRVTTTTTDFRTENNVDAHDTLIIDRADLMIEKTDIFAGPPAGPDNAFLQCDPVQPGGMITYNLTVTNNGPSDAAQVHVVDYLPTMGVALDPAQVVVNVTNGQVVEVRDDGRITVIVGNDVNNEGNPELGRMNVGGVETITIEVMVTQMAECGSFLENRAIVETRRNDLMWPVAPDLLPGVGGGPRTPTFDPNLANNTAVETTKVECPSVKVKKTVSYDGTCPGVDIRTINQTAQPVTFCFEITNDGTTWLDTIRITDTLVARTNGMPVVVFTDTITFGKDPKLPVAPGEVVNRQVTIPHLTKECGISSDYVDVTAVAVNSGRTVYPCLTVEPARDERFIDIPCAGLDWRLQLPKIDTEMCDTWVQVQNVGGCEPTIAMMVVWGDPGFCPPQAAGPLKSECSGLLRPGAAWSFAASQMPTGAKSAVVYSLGADIVDAPNGGRLPFGELVCDEFFFGAIGSHIDWAGFDSAYRNGLTWRGWDLGEYRGEAIAASVNRSCPDPVDANLTNHAAYTGISSDMNGAYDPITGAYMYYAPLIFAARGDLNTMLNIQNAGVSCTSLEIWFKAQDDCLRPILGDVLSVAPGETVMFDPNTIVGPDWLGGAWVRSTQPLGMIVDTHGSNHFTAYSGLPADNYELEFTFGNQINYAPLIYSEYQGWDTAIQVQNLSAITAAKVKVYFLDRSGDIITTLVDWVCPRGSQTFFLPLLANLPGGWVGSARVESQEWWSPGQPLVQPPKVSSIVLMERWSDPARTSRREAVAYNAQTECLLFDWQIAPGTKGGTSSGSAVFAIPLIAKGYNGITSEIGITNLVPKPGFTDFVIFMFDQNGLVDYVCQKLNEKQVEYIDLNTWGAVPQRFIGSMVVSAVFWEHDVFDSRGGFERNLVGLGGVAVERIGGTQGEPDVPGDESKAFEAIPLFDHFCPPVDPNCPGLPPRNE